MTRKVYPSHTSPQEAMRALAEAINLLVDEMPLSGVITVTSNANVTTDFGVWLGDATSGAITLTIPPAEAFTGKTFSMKKIDASANAVTVSPSDGTVDGAANYSLSSQWNAVQVTSDGDNWLITAKV